MSERAPGGRFCVTRLLRGLSIDQCAKRLFWLVLLRVGRPFRFPPPPGFVRSGAENEALASPVSAYSYVYILVSESDPSRHYTGLTDDLDSRLRKHEHRRLPAHLELSSDLSMRV